VGDRVVLQCYDKDEVGPVVYGHWSGQDALAAVERLRQRMATRGGDLTYWSARLVQELINGNEGNLGFGIWNQDKLLTTDDSHGDAGCVLIDVNTGKVRLFGGYLTATADALERKTKNAEKCKARRERLKADGAGVK